MVHFNLLNNKAFTMVETMIVVAIASVVELAMGLFNSYR